MNQRFIPVATPARERGVMLLEILVSLLIFSLGVLAVVGLQATSIKLQADAKYRADASFLAGQIVALMWSDRGANNANLANYQHRPVGGGADCTPTGGNSPNAAIVGSNMSNWLASVAAALPGADITRQQIIVAAGNLVTVTICWRAPQETSWHNYMLVTAIN
jgi:type IV pilus assembly protein PilV